jgi:hypothetical protein
MSVIDTIALWIGHAVLLYVGFIVAIVLIAGGIGIVWNAVQFLVKRITPPSAKG